MTPFPAENAMLFSRFKDVAKGQKLKDWVDGTRSEISYESWAGTFNGRKKGDGFMYLRPNLKTLLTMLYELQMSRDAMISILEARGETYICRLMAPDTLTHDEHALVEHYRSLNAHTKQALNNLVEVMTHG